MNVFFLYLLLHFSTKKAMANKSNLAADFTDTARLERFYQAKNEDKVLYCFNQLLVPKDKQDLLAICAASLKAVGKFSCRI